jgi:hypothetical protein
VASSSTGTPTGEAWPVEHRNRSTVHHGFPFIDSCVRTYVHAPFPFIDAPSWKVHRSKTLYHKLTILWPIVQILTSGAKIERSLVSLL